MSVRKKRKRSVVRLSEGARAGELESTLQYLDGAVTLSYRFAIPPGIDPDYLLAEDARRRDEFPRLLREEVNYNFFPNDIYGLFLTPTKLSQNFSPQLLLNELLDEAAGVMAEFKETRNQYLLLRFKQIMSHYRDMLMQMQRKFRRILGRLKAKLRLRRFADRRALVLIFKRLVNQSMDDEHDNVMNSALLKEIVHYLISLFHAAPYFKRKHYQAGVFFGRYQQ